MKTGKYVGMFLLIVFLSGFVLFSQDDPAAAEFTKQELAALELYQTIAEADTKRLVELLRADPSLANADHPDPDTFSPPPPLYEARLIRHKQKREIALNALADAKADLNARFGEQADTLLIDSIRRKDYAFSKFLLERGANLRLRNVRGETAVELARRSKDKTIITYLSEAMKHPDFQKAETIRTRFFSAAARGEIEELRTLIAEGTSMDLPSDEGDTVLSLAVKSGNSVVVRFAIEQKARLNQLNNLGQSPLLIALTGKNVEMVNLLLIGGASPNTADRFGMAPLSRLTALPEDDVMLSLARLLLDAGADVNAPDSYGSTALMYAVRRSQLQYAKLLLESGADKSIEDKLGQTAEKMTVNKDMLQILRETKPVPRDTPPKEVSWGKFGGGADPLLPDPESPAEESVSPSAAEPSPPEIVTYPASDAEK